ncbi:putative nucleic acid-binding Zn ribbon protein [Leucobacter exalbidus]|uniref:Nucleic acid-binding Zn ribbon protein n=1 Tax=Leucobacter exalbidus TaxID=662960 RepID=A0A940PTG3_9MICO|nr:DciA family protein [Leucobacter exalbidus]MBP1326562.1 putative nucleic acid-binding Zn ribbon protein [Leucobacter exalbidus]
MKSAKQGPSFPTEAYLRAKSVWRGVPAHIRRKRLGQEPGGSAFSKGRDPKALSDVLLVISNDMGWSADLERARLIEEWPVFAGESTAEHTTIIGITNDVLHVQCDSTTWATELRRLRGEIYSRMLKEYPEIDVKDIRFLSPGAPTWRHGPRTVQGRGPRDTYG